MRELRSMEPSNKTNDTISSRRSGDNLPTMYMGLADKYG